MKPQMNTNETDFDLTKSLEALEKNVLEEVSPDDKTPLINRALQLYRRPLNQFSTDDLRFMIGQEIGLNFLIPLAVEILVQNPLAQGVYYEGDLLSSVLSVNRNFWQKNPHLWWELEEIIYEAELIVENFQKNIAPEIKRFREFAPEIKKNE